MTRKDYVLIAAALRAARPKVLPGTNVIPDSKARTVWYAVVSEMAASLKADNARFDESMFFDNCGVPA